MKFAIDNAIISAMKKKFYQSKTIQASAIALAAAILAHFYGEGAQAQFQEAIALVFPLIAIVLRAFTNKGLSV